MLRQRLLKVYAPLCLALMIALLFLALPVLAAQLVVNTAVDESDGSCSDGDCSLRDAIAVAGNGDIITFAGSYTIYLNSNLNISKRLTVDGSSRTIKISGDTGGDGSPNVRVFYIGSSGVVTLTHLTIISGTAGTNGGGIYNNGTLTVLDSTLSNNSVTGYIRAGGGIYNDGGRLTVLGSTFSGNRASWGGGGIHNDFGTVIVSGSAFSGNSTPSGGGIYNSSGTATVSDSAFSGNSATSYDGGGIYNGEIATLTVQNSTFFGNLASSSGGGIFNVGSLTVQNSTFSSNSTNQGGGISNYSGQLTVQNSTFSGNSATYGGGGIDNWAALNLSNTLLANSPSGGDCRNNGGSIDVNDHNLIEGNGNACGLTNGVGGIIIGVDPLLAPLGNYGGPSAGSGQGILTLALLPGSPALDAGNACLATDQRGVARPQPGGGTCDIGAFESRGFTLTVAGGSGQSAPIHTLFPQPLSLTATGSLSEPVNGGQVVLTGPGSSAGTQPSVYTATISGGIMTQTVRANGATGSYPVFADTLGNLGSAASFSLTNLPLKTVVLGNGVVIADGDATPSLADDTDFGGVTPSVPVTHTYTISNSSSTVSLTVNSLSLSGAGAGDFTLSGPTVPMTVTASGTITFQARFDPAIFATRAATVTITSDDGPENAYDFSIQGTGVCANRISVTNANDDGPGSLRRAMILACDGGTVDFAGNYTIYLNNQLQITKTLTIDGSGRTVNLSGDSLGDGSPNVRVFYISSGDVVTLTYLNIISGTTTGDGGGIYLGGTLIVQNSTLSGNSASASGGGIYNTGASSTLTVKNSALSGNSAKWGGGLFNNFGTLMVQNSTLSSNSTTSGGGGIYNQSSSTLTVQNSTLSDNSAPSGGGLYNNSGTLQLFNTLIANSPSGGDCSGNVNTNDHNLIEGNGNACGLGNGAGGSIIGVDPLLASLGNYGGPSTISGRTHALLPGSPAIDAGNACLATDQRGVTRPQPGGGTCDIGAFESQGFTLTYGSGSGQSTLTHFAFPYPLSLTVSSNLSEPVNGGQVILTGPDSGAGTKPPVYTATISSGAMTQAVRANGTAGSYTVSANTRGNLGSAASFSLTNFPPKAIVSGNGIVITDGDTTPSLADHTDFGNVTPGWAITRTFTISNNSGTASLIAYSLGLSGAGAGDFALSGPTMPVTLTANSAITFQVRFTPAIFATSTATITLATDDGPENDYDFGIQGTGMCSDRISVTNADDVGFGSLRHVLNLVCNGGMVDFAANTTLYLNSQLEITKTLTIDGSGRTVKFSGDSGGDGTPNVRVLSIGSSGVVTLTHLTIISGTANLEVSGYEGGGIRNYGQLTLQDSTLSGNSATNYGGSLYNSGTLMVSDSTFSGNSTDFAGSGIYNTSGRITVTNSSLSGNLAEWGGGIYNASGSLTVQHSTFSGNSASSGFGGGIYNESGTLTVQHSSLSGNSGGNGGGGICNGGTLMVQASTLSGNTGYGGGGIYNGGTLTVQNSTLSGNSGDYGGGIFNYGPLTLQNSTFSGNSAGNGGGIENWNRLDLFNTLIANSPSGGDCANNTGGWIATNDHNLMQSALITDTCGLTNGSGGSIIGVDPLLRPLANNGGDTQTFSLLPGSLALDAGNNATCLATDQRGVARPQGPTCDIGAYEVAKLNLTKSVTPETHVLDHNTVTYTLVLGLEQGDVSVDPSIALTDTLPDQVLFTSWVISPANTVRSGNVITWTGALTAGDAITFTFTATYLGSSNQWVTNTATFSGTTWAGSATAGFQVAHLITPTAGVGGTITPSTVQIVTSGEERVFTIAPDLGYHIADVGVDGLSVGALTSYTFNNVTANHTLSAAFALNTYTITPTAGTGGSIIPGTSQIIDHGGNITFTIAPDLGYHILDVGVDGVPTGAVNVYTFTHVTADHTISATFGLNSYALTTNVVGQGQITRTPDQATYLYGSSVTLTAVPQPGWYFGQWLGDASGTLTQTMMLMDADKIITATFFNMPQTYYTLTLSLIGSGVITPTVGAHAYLSGTVVPLSASPTAGWRFIGWNGDVDCTDGSITMNANKLCTAAFARYQLYLPMILK